MSKYLEKIKQGISDFENDNMTIIEERCPETFDDRGIYLRSDVPKNLLDGDSGPFIENVINEINMAMQDGVSETDVINDYNMYVTENDDNILIESVIIFE